MPIVPIEQNHVGLAEKSGVKFRTPDLNGTGGEGLARGLAQIGQAVGQYAEVQDQIQDHADKITARDLALQYRRNAGDQVGQYKAMLGADAMNGGAAAQQSIAALRKDMAAQAGNGRVKRYFDDLTAPYEAEFGNNIVDHSRQQQFEFSKSTYASGVDLAKQAAAQSFADPAKQQQYLAEGQENITRLQKLLGWDDNTARVKSLEFTSGVHRDVIDQMLAAPDGGVDNALTYFREHEAAMTVDARNAVLKSLSGPLGERQAETDFLEVATGANKPVGDRQQVELPNGTYHLPVQGRVSNTFQDHLARGSAGLDIAAALGSGIKPVAGGKVIQVGQDARSGRFVRVQHTDGTISSYSHLGNVSVKGGQVLGADTILGTVGLTGHTTGPHLHLRIKDKSGKDIDPQSIMGGKAAGGMVIAGTDAARNWDQAGVLAAIDARTDWSPERKEAARAKARQRMAQDEAALADRYQDAGREAAGVIAKLGDGFTSTSQIPAGIRSRMDPVKLAEMDGDLRSRAAAAAKERAAEAQGAYATQLEFLKRFEPEQFKKLDPLAQVGKLSPSQFSGFMGNWLEANKPTNFVEEDLRGKINSEIEFQEKHGGPKLSESKKIELFDGMMAQLRMVHDAKGKGAIGTQDVTAAYRSRMREIPETGGWFGSNKRAFEVLGNVPADWEADFRRSWRGAQPPTRSQILQAWTLHAGKTGN